MGRASPMAWNIGKAVGRMDYNSCPRAIKAEVQWRGPGTNFSVSMEDLSSRVKIELSQRRRRVGLLPTLAERFNGLGSSNLHLHSQQYTRERGALDHRPINPCLDAGVQQVMEKELNSSW